MNKKSLILFAAAPLLLAACGKISNVPSFKKVKDSQKVSKEKWFLDYQEKANSYSVRLGQVPDEKGEIKKLESLELKTVKKGATLEKGKNKAGAKFFEKAEYSVESEGAYDSASEVYVKVESAKEAEEGNETKSAISEEFEYTYQKETVQLKRESEAHEHILEINELTKEYSAKETKKRAIVEVADVARRDIEKISPEMLEEYFENPKSVFYENDGVFTVILDVGKESLSEEEIKSMGVKEYKVFYEVQLIFEKDSIEFGEYYLQELECGESEYYNSYESKREYGARGVVEFCKQSLKKDNITKYCEKANYYL